MKILIEYESAWRNSFLDGSNNDPVPKNGRNFVGSMTSLKKVDNFKQRVVTKDTVMGVLNRLIGEQRKLYQLRQDPNYYLKDIDNMLTDEDFTDKPQYQNAEIVFLRNISGSTDQNSFTGMIKAQDPAFSSAFSSSLWGLLFLELADIFKFLTDESYQVRAQQTQFDPLIVINQLKSLNSLKAIDLSDDVQQALDIITRHFPDTRFKLTAKDQITPISFYTAALYLQVERLKNQFDLSTLLTKRGGLSGISKRGFTEKDFMYRYTTGDKKLIWGNPYMLKERIKGQGEVVSMLTKASGRLEIQLNISRERSREIEECINNAGVSAFYLGKKGLAYVAEIRRGR